MRKAEGISTVGTPERRKRIRPLDASLVSKLSVSVAQCSSLYCRPQEGGRETRAEEERKKERRERLVEGGRRGGARLLLLNWEVITAAFNCDKEPQDHLRSFLSSVFSSLGAAVFGQEAMAPKVAVLQSRGEFFSSSSRPCFSGFRFSCAAFFRSFEVLNKRFSFPNAFPLLFWRCPFWCCTAPVLILGLPFLASPLNF